MCSGEGEKVELTGLVDGWGVEGILTYLWFIGLVIPSPRSAKDLKQLIHIINKIIYLYI